MLQTEKNSITIGNLAGIEVRDRINRERIDSIPVLLPRIPEQHDITAIHERETTKIDALSAKEVIIIDRFREYPTALVNTAIIREINVSATLNTSVRRVV